MKGETLISCLCASVIAFLLGFGAAACMVTGLKLPADLLLLALVCGIEAVLAAACYSLRRGGLVLGGIGAAFCLLCAFSSRFHSQLKAMGFHALQYYNRAYGLSIPEWLNGHSADSHLLPLLLIAGLVITAAAWTVMRRKRSILAVIGAILPLTSCLIVTDTVPSALPLFLLITGLVLLLMSQPTRRQRESHGNRLTAILILPVCAAVMGLFLLVPQGDYSAPEQIQSMQGLLDWFAQQIPVVEQTTQGELVISIGGNAKQEINLTRVGQRVERNTPVMELSTQYTGTMYLRGRDYDIYTGLGWEVSQDRIEKNYGPPSAWLQEQYTASVQILGRRGQYYLPCYPTQQLTLTDGMLPNPDYIKSYSFEFSPLRPDWQTLWQMYQDGFSISPSVPEPDAQYLQLPQKTQQQAKQILKTFLISEDSIGQLTVGIASTPSKAAQIEAYVKNSAVYDLNPGRMPGSEDDFALWFLADCDSGYCIHFATAATVLLRAAGIPARYVEGYTVHCANGETTVVREKQAHAWVEYYVEHLGWVILDPTPGATEPEPTTVETTASEAVTVPSVNPTEAAPTTPAPSAPTATEQDSKPSESQVILPSEDSTDSSATAPQVMPQWFLTILHTLAWIAAAVLLIVGQWILRRYLKQKQLQTGSPNTQARKRFREAHRLARLCKLPLPDHLTVLAEKASFSQYTLTHRELEQFDVALMEYTQTLREKPWYCRLVCRLVFAAY